MVLLLFTKFLRNGTVWLVNSYVHVKIGDFKMSRALANESTGVHSYYKLSSTVKLPLKWMTIESLAN